MTKWPAFVTLAVAPVALASCSPARTNPPISSPPPAPTATVESPDQAARAASEALSWLTLVDEGKYGESWKLASSAFKRGVDEAGWAKAAASARDPFGKLISRQPKHIEHATTLPGAPDGDYFVMKFETSFERKKAAIETVIAMKDIDGSWRVAGYFVR